MAAPTASDSRVGPAIGLTWLPTVSHQAVCDVLRARIVRRNRSAAGDTPERFCGADFNI
jgi:hypothetical protein